MILRLVAQALDKLLAKVREGESFDIGSPDRVYMRRWFVIPRNKFFNIYHHEFQHSDDDRALHDHPWCSVSLLLQGSLREITASDFKDIEAGSIAFRSATFAHRIVLTSPVARSLFITGPIIREWGFYCPQGWRHWKDFTAYRVSGDKGQIGPGCE